MADAPKMDHRVYTHAEGIQLLGLDGRTNSAPLDGMNDPLLLEAVLLFQAKWGTPIGEKKESEDG